MNVNVASFPDGWRLYGGPYMSPAYPSLREALAQAPVLCDWARATSLTYGDQQLLAAVHIRPVARDFLIVGIRADGGDTDCYWSKWSGKPIRSLEVAMEAAAKYAAKFSHPDTALIVEARKC